MIFKAPWGKFVGPSKKGKQAKKEDTFYLVEKNFYPSLCAKQRQ